MNFITAKYTKNDLGIMATTAEGGSYFIPCTETNADYRAIIASGIEIAPADD